MTTPTNSYVSSLPPKPLLPFNELQTPQSKELTESKQLTTEKASLLGRDTLTSKARKSESRHMDLELLEVQSLFRQSECARDISIAVFMIRQFIEMNPKNGYAELANCINELKLPLDQLELTKSELRGISPFIKHLDFGQEFDFSEWMEEDIFGFIKSCKHLQSLSIHTGKITGLPGGMTSLVELNCFGCRFLAELPGDMTAITKLNVDWCLKLAPHRYGSLIKEA